MKFSTLRIGIILGLLFAGIFSLPAATLLQWQISAGSGTTLADSSGNGNTGTFCAGGQAPTWASPRGLSFSGNQCVTVSDSGFWGSVQSILIALKPDQVASLSTPGQFNIALSESNASDTVGSPAYAISLPAYAITSGSPAANYKMYGVRILRIVLGSPCAMYLDGVAVDGFIEGGPCTIHTAGGTMALGTSAWSLSSGWSFYGQIYWVELRSDTTDTTSTISSSLTGSGLTVGDQNPAVTQLIMDGDSRAANSENNTFLYTGSIAKSVLSLLPSITFNMTNQGWLGLGITEINARPGNPTDIFATRFPSNTIVYNLFAGTNDLVLHQRSAAVTYSAFTTDVSDKQSHGMKLVVHTELPRLGSTCFPSGTSSCQTQVDTYSASVRANWGFGTTNATGVALADYANDPNLGCTGCESDSTRYWTNLHPTAAANALLAIYDALAILQATGQ